MPNEWILSFNQKISIEHAHMIHQSTEHLVNGECNGSLLLYKYVYSKLDGEKNSEKRV